MSETWLDGPILESTWQQESERLLIICPEPNEEWTDAQGDTRRDMRLNLLEPTQPRKGFYRRIREAVRAYRRLPPGAEVDGDEVLQHRQLASTIAFVDLNNVGAGAEARERRVLRSTERRRRELVDQIGSMNPSHIAVCGGIAQRAFSRFVWPHLRQDPVPVVFFIDHPSSYMNVDAYYAHVSERLAQSERLE